MSPLQSQILLQILVGLIFAFLLFYVRHSLESYFKEKAKNLATKEDLRELTKIAETVKSDHSRANTVHKVQFEAEFRCYQDLWRATLEARAALFTVSSFYSESETNPNLQAAEEKYLGDTQELMRVIVTSEPFIPPNMHEAFAVISYLFPDDDDGKNGTTTGFRFWVNSGALEEKRQQFHRLEDAARDAIQARLGSVSVIN